MGLGELTAEVKKNLKAIAALFSRNRASEEPRIDDAVLPDDSAEIPQANENTRSAGFLLNKFVKAVPDFLSSVENRFLRRFPEEKRRPILLAIAGSAMLFLVLIISVPVTLSGRPRQAGSSRAVSGPVIPVEELFIPSEPDFLPEFILEREPRSFWSLEDLRPYWRALESTELWREQITSAVDRLMESVP